MHKANPINVKENLIITHFKPQFKEKSVSDMHRVVEQTGHRRTGAKQPCSTFNAQSPGFGAKESKDRGMSQTTYVS